MASRETFSSAAMFLVLMAAMLLRVPEASCSADVRRLLGDLLHNYNTLERPVSNNSDPIQVKIGLTLQQILDVDEREQIMTTNSWLQMEWTDENLKWNESEYNGVKSLRIPADRIWQPDIFMYNSANSGPSTSVETLVVLSSNGNCLIVPPGIYKSTCKMDLTWFPFDEQNCKMKFGSWTYSGFQIDLQLSNEDGGDVSDFITNGEWELIGVPAKRNVIYYQCCPEPYIDTTFTVKLRRKPGYYLTNVLLPSLLLTGLALLSLTLPPACGERLFLGAVVLMSMSAFSSKVSDLMPKTSDTVPLLGVYLNSVLVVVVLSLVTSVGVLNLHHRSPDHPSMSSWVRAVFLEWLPRILLVKRPGKEFSWKSLTTDKNKAKNQPPNLVAVGGDEGPLIGNHVNAQTGGDPVKTLYPGPPADLLIEGNTNSGLLLQEVQVISGRIKKDQQDQQVCSDWQFAARVLDRLCLVVLCLATAAVTASFLLMAPYFSV